ncbi:MAG TPA: hypothetical protein VMV12_02230 [Candidatus Micrarchaeaceae archaeon]|nr:hypothetical protein [Candidatus Micrarchaeaceae archaeon]HVB13268.1 hypothetical protein [Candidatus Dormibacteraeota bacterium]
MNTDPAGESDLSNPAPTEAQRYPNLGTQGVSVSSSAAADIPVRASRTEGWVVATALLVAGCISMGIYLVVLHH